MNENHPIQNLGTSQPSLSPNVIFLEIKFIALAEVNTRELTTADHQPLWSEPF